MAASALIVTAARRAGDEGMVYSEFADYDLGQAVAHLTIQAGSMGLSCHQFRAFDLDELTEELRPVEGWCIVSIVAVGVGVGGPPVPRARRSVEEVISAPWH